MKEGPSLKSKACHGGSLLPINGKASSFQREHVAWNPCI